MRTWPQPRRQGAKTRHLEEFDMLYTIAFGACMAISLLAQTPPSSAYDYHNPGSPAIRAPLLLTVEEGEF